MLASCCAQTLGNPLQLCVNVLEGGLHIISCMLSCSSITNFRLDNLLVITFMKQSDYIHAPLRKVLYFIGSVRLLGDKLGWACTTDQRWSLRKSSHGPPFNQSTTESMFDTLRHIPCFLSSVVCGNQLRRFLIYTSKHRMSLEMMTLLLLRRMTKN
jgi:hypothetical protein